MKKIIGVLLLVCFAVWPVTASAEGLLGTGDFSLPDGGVKVAAVEALPEGTSVVMVGRIEEPQGGTLYKFSDPTGTIQISVDYVMQDQVDVLNVNDIVEIYGTTAHDFDKFFVIVNRIVKR